MLLMAFHWIVIFLFIGSTLECNLNVNFNVLLVPSRLNKTGLSELSFPPTIQLAITKSLLLQNFTSWIPDLMQFQVPALIIIEGENLVPDEFIDQMQNIFMRVRTSKSHWLPVFLILLNSQEREYPWEVWATKIPPDCQVYFAFQNSSDNNLFSTSDFIELYSVKNATIHRKIFAQNKIIPDDHCPFPLLHNIAKITYKKSLRRLNFQKALITAVNVDDLDYPESTKFKHNGSVAIGFESGFEVNEYWYLRDALNFTEAAVAWKNYVRQAPNGSLTGMAIPINEGIADMCIGYTEFLLYRVTAPNGITFLHPTFYNEILAFFKQPGASSIRDIFLNTFSKEIWLAIGFCWLVIVLLLLLFLRLKQINNAYLHPLDACMYNEAWIWAASAICQQGWHVTPFSTSVKIIFFSGVTAGLLFYIAYSAALVAILSVKVTPVKTFSDLLDNEFDIFSDNHIPTAKFVVNSLEDSGKIKKLQDDGRNVETEVIMPKMVKNKIALVSFPDAFYQFLLKKDYSVYYLCNTVSKVKFSQRPAVSSMFVKRTSPLRDYFNVKIALMKERGVLYRLRNRYLDATSISCLSVGGSIQQLALKDVVTAFFILAAGTTISIVSVFIEHVKASTAYKQALKRIKPK